MTSLAAYYGELRAIYDVSTSNCSAGDVLAIIGANGAGKSTLLRSLVGLMNHGARSHIRGSIEFGGPAHRPARRPSASSTWAWRWCPKAGGFSRA